ncbi:hypothetical protein [Alkaliphilus oremlandii]|nr:hypothetical protein [Alkaliphilus oremlandii]
MGRNYSLQIVVDETIKVPEAKLSRGKFVVPVENKDFDRVRLTLENWYKDKVKKKIFERVA